MPPSADRSNNGGVGRDLPGLPVHLSRLLLVTKLTHLSVKSDEGGAVWGLQRRRCDCVGGWGVCL